MGVAYRAGATANDGQTGTSLTAPFTIPVSGPGGPVVVGDTALVCTAQNSGVSDLSAPEGWRLLGGPVSINSNLRTALWAKDLAAGDIGGEVDFGSDVGARLPGAMSIYSGTSAAAISIIEMGVVTAAALSLSLPEIATAVDGSLLAAMWALRDNTGGPSATLAVPSTHTARSVSRTAAAAAPNFTVQASHRTDPVDAGTYGGSTGTASDPATAIIWYVELPPKPVATPVASITATPVSGDAPLAVTFTDTSTGSPTSWVWDFGDGTTSTAQNPTHTYASAGLYSVTLTVTNPGGSDTSSPTPISASKPSGGTGGGLHLFMPVDGVWVPLTPYQLTDT